MRIICDGKGTLLSAVGSYGMNVTSSMTLEHLWNSAPNHYLFTKG